MNHSSMLIQPNLHLHFHNYPYKTLHIPSNMTVYDVSDYNLQSNESVKSIQIMPSANNVWIWSYNSVQDCRFLYIGSQSCPIFIDLSGYTNHLAVIFDADTFYSNMDTENAIYTNIHTTNSTDSNIHAANSTNPNIHTTHSIVPSILRNHVIEWKPQAQTPPYPFIDELIQTHSFDEHIKVLVNYINQYTQCCHFPAAFQTMMDMILHTNETFSLQDISNQTRYSIRHINRMFNNYLGYGSKMLYKYTRFQKVLREIINNPNRQISKFILNMNYSDQAHFQREFKTFMGETPKTFCRQIATIQSCH